MATVLVIEDDVGLRRVVARAVSRQYSVVEAENGRDGLEMFRKHRPDVVVTDILMPQKDGIETIREIREMVPAAKIIAISGGGMSHNLMFLDIARAFGVDAVLSKPFPLAELLQTLERLLLPKSSTGTTPGVAPLL
ncbi:MAG: response regulator [Stellaceae bacterium]